MAVDLLAAVAISSALHQRIVPRLWRGLHWLAYACWPLAMAHALGAGTDAARLWMDAVAAVCTIAVVCALTWRIVNQRTSSEAAARVGSTTRAVPVRHRSVARRTPDLPPCRDADYGTATSTQINSTQLLERDPR